MRLTDFYDYSSYKRLLIDIMKMEVNHGYGQASRLAKALKVHSSLVSQILNGSKDFSPEQAINVAKFFSFTSKETEFFVLLLLFEKAGTAELRAFYQRQLESFRKSQQKIINRISGVTEIDDAALAFYYSDWSYMAVWLACSIDGLQSVKDIAKRLGMAQEETERILDFLVQMGICRLTKNGFEPTITKTHLPANSPLVQRHHINWRLKAIGRSTNVGDNELMFTAPMTLAKSDLPRIRSRILELIQDTSEMVKKSNPEELALLNIDFIII